MIKYDLKEMQYISQKHSVMKSLVEHYGKLELGKISDVYTSLVLHIISQMLSNSVADTLIKRFLKLVGEIEPKIVGALDAESIRECGISNRKAEYIIALFLCVMEGRYDFSLLDAMSDDEAVKYLMQIKGVGKWTAEMIVEFTLGRLNIFSYEDVALQNGIKKAHGFKTLSKLRFDRLRKTYSPYCSVASVYYYAYNDDKSGWLIPIDNN